MHLQTHQSRICTYLKFLYKKRRFKLSKVTNLRIKFTILSLSTLLRLTSWLVALTLRPSSSILHKLLLCNVIYSCAQHERASILLYLLCFVSTQRQIALESLPVKSVCQFVCLPLNGDGCGSIIASFAATRFAYKTMGIHLPISEKFRNIHRSLSRLTSSH